MAAAGSSSSSNQRVRQVEPELPPDAFLCAFEPGQLEQMQRARQARLQREA